MKFFTYFLLLTSSIITITYYNDLDDQTIKPKRLIPPAPELADFHLGYRQILADSYWLRLLQDFAYCSENEVRFEDTISPEGRRMGPNRKYSCYKGWSYHMLDIILSLAPRFHYAAHMGPLSLSVVTDDIPGATEVFKIATKLFPNDWVIQYQAGYHFFLELEDYETAIQYFEKSLLLGAPRWLPLLISKLQTKAGQRLLAESTLRNYIQSVEDNETLKQRALKKLNSLQQENKKAQ